MLPNSTIQKSAAVGVIIIPKEQAVLIRLRGAKDSRNKTDLIHDLWALGSNPRPSRDILRPRRPHQKHSRVLFGHFWSLGPLQC